MNVLLTCEHASNAVPDGWDPGVGGDVLASHVAWDQGARIIAEALRDRLGAPLFLGRYTRLYVDLNRFPHRPSVIPEVAFGVPVPANHGLGDAEREARLAAAHRPWREAVRAAATAAVGRGPLLHLSIHSFTPALGADVRDYDMGILFDPGRDAEGRAAAVLIGACEAGGLSARPNQPYAGAGDGVTSWLRTLFPDAAYAGIEVETSHRVTEADGGCARVAAAVGDAVAAAYTAAFPSVG